jgi:membrane protease YdiL (CAAX protease family)
MASFFLADDRRLKCGWRVGFFFVAQILLQMLVGIVFSIALIFIMVASGKEFSQSAFMEHLDALTIPISCSAMIMIYPLLRIFRRYIDKKSFISLGLFINKRTLHQAGFGIVLGLVAISGAILILYVLGGCEINGFSWHDISLTRVLGLVLASFVVMSIVGMTEELIMRGYIMGNLMEKVKPMSAILISSLLFMLMHLLNPGINLIAVTNIFLAGILLGLAFYRSGSLWLPIGLHFSWNFAQNGIYSLPVSGQPFTGLVDVQLVGPELLTGSNFGIEGGFIGSLMILALIMIILFIYRKPQIQ